jgi:hypothetical protein
MTIHDCFQKWNWDSFVFCDGLVKWKVEWYRTTEQFRAEGGVILDEQSQAVLTCDAHLIQALQAAYEDDGEPMLVWTV